MKNLLLFCFVAMFAVYASVAWAEEATPPVGATCDYNEQTLQNGAVLYVDCGELKFKNAAQCFVYCNNGELIHAISECNDAFYTLGPITIPRANMKAFGYCGTYQEACEAADEPATWHAEANPPYCDCGTKDEEWNKETMQCEQTDDYKKCIETKTDENKQSYWDYDAGACICVNKNSYRWDTKLHECVPLPTKKECEKFIKLVAEGKFEGKVKWNEATSTCDCIKDKDGKTITNPEDWFVGDRGCEKLQSTINREDIAKNNPVAVNVSDQITQIAKDLEGISGDWERSRWKNASGGFNTARLASDSIAGVVLGTVGGVITSNVIKKNQVKGGFEDINCSIGGQRVADFGDQFRVGIGFGAQ